MPLHWITLNALVNGTIVASKVIGTCAISGPYEICNIGGQNYYFSTGESATWSVTSGFSVVKDNSSSVEKAIVTPAPLAGQTGTLTAVVNGRTYTKAIKACLPSIYGPNDICNSGTFTISYNYSATNWSATSGFSVSATTGNSVTVTAGPNAGAGTITAVVNGITLTKDITKCGYVPLSIVGPDVVFTSSTATYSLSTGQTATWTVLPSTNFTHTVNGGGTSVTVTPTGISGGVGGAVSASVSGGNSVSRQILICGISGSVQICGTETYTLTNNPYTINNWLSPAPGFTLVSSNSTSATIQTNYTNGENGAVVVFINNPAGGIITLSRSITASCRGGSSSSSVSRYVTAYPNPVDDILYIDIDADAAHALLPVRATLTFDARLYDGQGNLLHSAKTQGGTVKFNVSNLLDGLYYLHVYDGVNSMPEMLQIVVER
jgi:hypothetical protein